MNKSLTLLVKKLTDKDNLFEMVLDENGTWTGELKGKLSGMINGSSKVEVKLSEKQD